MFLGWDIGLSSVSRLVNEVDQLFSPNCVHNAQFVNVTCKVVMTYENSGKFAFSASPRKFFCALCMQYQYISIYVIYTNVLYIWHKIAIQIASGIVPNVQTNK